jgi:hypothetical protein
LPAWRALSSKGRRKGTLVDETSRLEEAARQGAVRILQAGNIELTPELHQRAVARIGRIARLLVDQETVSTFKTASDVLTHRIARPSKNFDDETGRLARGRNPDRVGDQIIDKLAWFWFDYTDTVPTIPYVKGSRTKPPRYSGMFLRVVQAFCTELYEDLYDEQKGQLRPDFNVTDDLVNAVSQLRTNGRKAYDRLHKLRQDGRWLLPTPCARCGATGFQGEQPCPECNFDGAIEKPPSQ